MGWMRGMRAALISVALVVGVAGARGQGVLTTTVSDVVRDATGAPETGVLLISWPAFTTASGQAVPAGQTSAAIGADGRVSVSLAPNAGASPAGVSYRVVYKIDAKTGSGSQPGGLTNVEWWIVPSAGNAVTIGAVRAQQVPATVAMQTVTKAYVDQAIQNAAGTGTGATADAVSKTGDTMTGPLVLAGDPTAALQAADKHYVDAQVTTVSGQIGGRLARYGDTPQSLADVRYANQFSGATAGDQMDAACADLAGAQGVVVVPSSMAAGWSKAGVPDNCVIEDMRGAGGSAGAGFYKGLDVFGRYTAVKPGLNVIQPLLLESDAYAGGVNQSGTKTQYGSLRAEMDGRTLGERKNVAGFLRCEGKGNCFGGAQWAQDWGGYGASGDEGTEGGRFEADQADGSAYPVPVGAVTAVSGSAVTANWTNGTNAWLGEGRALINVSRGVYSAGTVQSAGMAAGACTVTGTGTQWAQTFGAGAHQDLFLEISANNGAHLRWTVPVAQVVDDTHLTLDYQLAELGTTCLGATMAQSGAYKLYRGGRVSGLGAVATGTRYPVAVTLAAGAANFQAGDQVEEPAGYNFRGTGLMALVSRDMGEPQGSGVYVGNTGAAAFAAGLRMEGPFVNGLLVNGALSGDGLTFNEAVGSGYGALVRSNDTQAANTRLLLWMNGSGAARSVDYNRTGEYLSLPGGQTLGTTSAQMALGASPQANVLAYLNNASAGQSGLVVANTGAAGNAAQIVTVSGSGVTGFKTWPQGAEFNNGMTVTGYAGNESAPTWSLNGATGTAVLAAASIGKATVGTGVSLNDATATAYDVGLNAAGLTGVSLNPVGASRKYGLFAGSPGNQQGMLEFWDWTANQSVLSYSAASGWTANGKMTVSGLRLTGGAADPSPVGAGDAWFNTTLGRARMVDGGGATHSLAWLDDVKRVCTVVIGAENGAALQNADLAPKGRVCLIPANATVVEITVSADGGMPSVVVARNRAGVLSDLTASAVATAANGGLACANAAGSGAGMDGTTSCSVALQNTALQAGDWLDLHAGTAGGVAKRMSVAVTWVSN